MEQPPEEDRPRRESSPEAAPPDTPPEHRPAGLFVRRRPGEEFPEPKPVPRWMILAGECALFGLPVLLVILPFGPRLPEFALEPPWGAVIDLACVLATVFGAGAAVRAFVLGRSGGALRRFGSRAREWYAAGRNRSVWTYCALLGLWMFAFQLPRISGVPALVLAGTLLFCVAAAFVIFTCGLMVAARRRAQGGLQRAESSGDLELAEGVAAGEGRASGEEQTSGEGGDDGARTR